MRYCIEDIAKSCNGVIVGKSDFLITQISTDSRNVSDAANTLFFAINGKNLDAHRFIPDLIDKGLCCFVVTDTDCIAPNSNQTFIVVKDIVYALQQVASMHRQRFNIPIIGITGSNGKTIVKEWLSFLLGNTYRVTRSPRSYNSQTGVPLSVWALSDQSQLGIFEAGISEPGEMEKLQQVILPNVGVFTNIGDAHQQYFESLDQKASEKANLFTTCNKVVCPVDNKRIFTAIKSVNPGVDILGWSFEGNGEINVIDVSTNNGTSSISLQHKKSVFKVVIPFIGSAWVENAITCFATLLILGEDPTNYINRFAQLPSVAMRMEVLNGINACRIINDSYNSDFQALSISLEQLIQQSGERKTLLIVSDILQSGKPDHVLYKDLSDLLRIKRVNTIIGVGSAISKHRSYFSGNTHFYSSTEHLLQSGTLLQMSQMAILLKGARPFAFEQIVKLLQEKSHQTVFEINLNAIENNLNYFRQITGNKTRVMVMVKAFSYGSGYYEIAHHLQYLKADYLAVAYTDEGVALRKAGIYLPIIVMNPEPDSFNLMIDNRLEPEIYSIEILNQFSSSLAGYVKPYPIHLKFDSGMHRLGFMPSELNELVCALQNISNIEVASVFTHLVGTDNEIFDEFTHTQVKLFLQMCNALPTSNFLKHVLNSNGIIRFPEYHFDMVRLGIGMYGIVNNTNTKLESTGVFKTSVSQIRNLNAGETVSYNRSGKLTRDSIIATIPVGYADGINRKLGNGNWFMQINEKNVPTIGDICMDMCMLDITDVTAMVGDEVIIINGAKGVMEMADTLKTIPYEILTGIGQRVKRVYIKE